MKSLLSLLFSIVLAGAATAQTFREKDLKTDIQEVTVFLNSAQIFESGSTSLAAGKTSLTIKNLSPYLDDKSIQVKGDGDFTILSVHHKLNYFNAIKKDKKADSLHTVVRTIEESMTKERSRLEILKEKSSLLNANKSLGGTAGVSVLQLKQAIDLFESELLKIKEEENRLVKTLEERRKEAEKINQQLKELNDLAVMPTSEIEVRVNADGQTTGKFRVTYLVGNAGWFPKYDVRVDNIRKPLRITYKAEVFQNTGIDWKNVKLRFSNGNPSQSGMVPTLHQWNLTFARLTTWNSAAIYGSRSTPDANVRFVKGRIVDSSGNPLPGVNVLIKGTTIGTVTDASGNYFVSVPDHSSTLVVSFIGYQSQEIPIQHSAANITLHEDTTSLQEVVVTGYGQARTPIRIRGTASLKANDYKRESNPLATTTIENQTTVEIEVADPYSIKSNGEKMLIDLKVIEANALYEYYAVPKLDKDAFLMARIVNWDQYNLLEGEANLYFEEAFVGRSILNAKSLEDTLNISLGRDKNIVVGREKNEEFCKRKSLGANISETRGFKLMVRNKKSQPVNITIFDQLPVSLVSDITVTPEELSGGKLDESSGKVTWQLKIDPQQQKDLKLHYEVRYPKRERVILE